MNHLPATASPVVATPVSYDELVRANTTRYALAAPGFVDVDDVRAPDAGLVARRDAIKPPIANEVGLVLLLVCMLGAAMTFAGVLTLLAAAPVAWPLLVFPPLATAAAGRPLLADLRREGDRGALDARIVRERSVTVQVPVAEAYRRLQSAVVEVDDDDREHSAEARASVRLAVEGAREIAALLHEHHDAGTLGSNSAQALTAEIYRLASEVDAYLTLHNADRYLAPGDGDAVAVLASTTQLSMTAAAADVAQTKAIQGPSLGV